MSTVFSLHSTFANWLEQARGWLQRSQRPRTGGESGDQSGNRDDLYEIFLFGPHG